MNNSSGEFDARQLLLTKWPARIIASRRTQAGRGRWKLEEKRGDTIDAYKSLDRRDCYTHALTIAGQATGTLKLNYHSELPVSITDQV
eukprot:92598-Amorphochlora_amoeboformis.AAC.1